MSDKRYTRTCDFCGKLYIAKSLKSRFDTDNCRSDFRRSQKKLGLTLGKDNQKPKITNPDLEPPLSASLPSDQRFQEKRPEVQRNTYTKTDVWILLARINRTILNDGSTLLAQLNSKRITDSLIWDFEKRFLCKFEEVLKANPDIHPGKTDLENQAIADRYAHLKYSR
jgi:hypothetical protein